MTQVIVEKAQETLVEETAQIPAEYYFKLTGMMM